MHDESRVVIRGAYFRICADGTLRGPDNGIVSRYADGLWQLRRGWHRAFDCNGPVFIRVANSDGRREQAGPYPLIKVTGGAIFVNESCLAVHDSQQAAASMDSVCREIAFLSGA